MADETTGEMILSRAKVICKHMGHEYVTPEHVLASFVLTKDFENTLTLFNLHVNDIANLLNEYFSKLDILPEGDDSEPGESYFFTELRERYEQEKPNYDPAYHGYLLLMLLLEQKVRRQKKC